MKITHKFTFDKALLSTELNNHFIKVESQNEIEQNIAVAYNQ